MNVLNSQSYAINKIVSLIFVHLFLLIIDVHKVKSLEQGKTYYITVKGCSTYSGCTWSYSDSITIDVTGPVTQQLHHGLTSSPALTQFQASRFVGFLIS